MKNENNFVLVDQDLNPLTNDVEYIKNMIYTIRGKKVLIDSDVARLYHYETKNIILKYSHGGRRYLPYVFTEQGIAMLAGILKSDIIDNNEIYHCGASLKDLGKKCFAINKMEDRQIIEYLIN